jgi:hypothetical protein
MSGSSVMRLKKDILMKKKCLTIFTPRLPITFWVLHFINHCSSQGGLVLLIYFCYNKHLELKGIWGGGNPKPFQYTEIQKHRFGLKDKNAAADRKVPLQPLAFTAKDGKISRYNLRKVCSHLHVGCTICH